MDELLNSEQFIELKMVKFRKGVLILRDFDNNEEATSAHWRITSEEILPEPYRGIDFTAHCEDGR